MDKKIIRGALSLLLIQGANFLLPLVTFPYLLRVLGPHEFGRLVFSQATIAYFVLLTDYGFNLTGTRRVAQCSDDFRQLSKTYWEITSAKFLLAGLSFIVLFVLTATVPAFSAYRDTIASSFPLVIGSVLFPQWLFQGLERLGFISVCSITARFATIPLTFWLVEDAADTWLAALIHASGQVMAGLIAIYLLIRYRLVGFSIPSPRDILKSLEDGWHVFISTAAISLYTTTNTVVLGILTTPSTVGFFAAADKIRAAGQSLMTPLSNAVFPRVASLMDKDRKAAFSLIRKLLLLQGGIGLAMSLILFIFAPQVIALAMGSGYEESTHILRILAWLPFVIGLSNVFGVQTMLNLGMKRPFSRILLASGIINLTLLIPLVIHADGIGAAIAVLTTECCVTLFMYLTLRSKNISIINKGKIQ